SFRVSCVSETSVTVPMIPLFSTNFSWATLEAILSLRSSICCSIAGLVGVGVGLAAYEFTLSTKYRMPNRKIIFFIKNSPSYNLQFFQLYLSLRFLKQQLFL